MSSTPSGYDGFTKKFRAAVEGMEWADMARACMTSVPTVIRWYGGKSAPRHVARASVFAALEKAHAERT